MTASGLPQNPPNPLNAANSARSTYQYTNSVPLCGAFNIEEWRDWEGRIRQFALQCTAAPTNGVMYLITGVSFVGVSQPAQPPQPSLPTQASQPSQAPQSPQAPRASQLPQAPHASQAVQVPILPFPNQPNPPVNPDAAIDQPNLMWTMGNCVPKNGQPESFAVIGNNVAVKAAMQTQQIPTAQLMAIIQDDVRINGLKRSTVKKTLNLFPGITNSKDVKLPETEYPPEESKEPSTSTPSPQSHKPASRKPASPKPASPKPASPKPASPKMPNPKPASPKIPSSQPSSPPKKKAKKKGRG